MSSKGVEAKEVLSELETTLEGELGAATRSEIIIRASTLMAIARPFELEAFRYYDQLCSVLDSAREFCDSKNIFTLRGEYSDGKGSLLLPKVSPVLRSLLKNSGALVDDFQDQDTIAVSVVHATAVLTTNRERLYVHVLVQANKTDHMGGTYTRGGIYGLALAVGTQVNRIGFRIDQRPERSFARDFEIMLNSDEFKKFVLAIYSDLTDYANELLKEQGEFKDEIRPALEQVLSALRRPKQD